MYEINIVEVKIYFSHEILERLSVCWFQIKALWNEEKLNLISNIFVTLNN
jgi:hypothetical protein